jgi:hypothetical protein
MTANLMDGYAAYANAQAIVEETANAVHAGNQPDTSVTISVSVSWSVSVSFTFSW